MNIVLLRGLLAGTFLLVGASPGLADEPGRPITPRPAPGQSPQQKASPRAVVPSRFSEPLLRALTALSEDFLVTSNLVGKKPNLPLFQHLSRTVDSPQRSLAMTYTNMHGTFELFQALAQQIGFARLKTAQLAFIQGFFTYAAGASFDQQVAEAERRGTAPPDEPPGRSTILQPAIDARNNQLAPYEAERDRLQREAAKLYHEVIDETRRLVVSLTEGLPLRPEAVVAKPDPRREGLPGYIMLLNTTTQTLHHCVIFATGVKNRAQILGSEPGNLESSPDEEPLQPAREEVEFLVRDHRLVFHVLVLPPRVPVYLKMGDRGLISVLQSATVEIFSDELMTGSQPVYNLRQRAFEIEAARMDAQERGWPTQGRLPIIQPRPAVPVRR